jgi:16S rRNA (guanine966-N2)-methyltransferase
LSRGAAHLTSLDVDTGAVKRVERNMRALGVGRDRMMVVKADASAYARRPRCAGEPYGLVLLDPPYANDASVSEALVADLAAAGKLTEGCVVVYEHADKTPHFALEGFEERRHKVYGTISFDVLRRVGEHA